MGLPGLCTLWTLVPLLPPPPVPRSPGVTPFTVWGGWAEMTVGGRGPCSGPTLLEHVHSDSFYPSATLGSRTVSGWPFTTTEKPRQGLCRGAQTQAPWPGGPQMTGLEPCSHPGGRQEGRAPTLFAGPGLLPSPGKLLGWGGGGGGGWGWGWWSVGGGPACPQGPGEKAWEGSVLEH